MWRWPSILSYHSCQCSPGKQHHSETQNSDLITRFGCSCAGSGNASGSNVGQCSVLIKSIKGRARPTCSARGFQRMFFSRAGAELSVLCGRFFRVRDTTPLSALSEPTRLRNCQPTCGFERVTACSYNDLDNEQQSQHYICIQLAV